MNEETKIQRKIQDYLNSKRIFNFRVNADTNTVGIPDLIACYKGTFIGIEVKTPDGRATGIQNKIGQEIVNCGGIFIKPTCVDDIITLISYMERNCPDKNRCE